MLSEVVMHFGLILNLYNIYTLSKNYSNIDHRGKETLEDELIVFLDWLIELNRDGFRQIHKPCFILTTSFRGRKHERGIKNNAKLEPVLETVTVLFNNWKGMRSSKSKKTDSNDVQWLSSFIASRAVNESFLLCLWLISGPHLLQALAPPTPLGSVGESCHSSSATQNLAPFSLCLLYVV